MLEGPPFASELARLTSKFTTAAFKKVFRDSKIDVRTVSNIAPPPGFTANQHIAPVQSQRISPSQHNNGNRDNSADSSWPTLSAAQLTKQEKPKPENLPLAHPSISPQAKPLPEGAIGRNGEGIRVDQPLKPSSQVVTAIKGKKMCNNHHLKGYCANSSCQYQHGVPVEYAEREALRFLARQVPCSNGLYCDDMYCYYGHRYVNTPFRSFFL